MALKLYRNHLDAASRAVETFLRIAKIDYEAVTVDVLKGETKTEEFKKNVNDLGMIPAIAHTLEGDEEPFKLSESAAILRYLSDHFKVSEDLYPRADFVRRARIDFFLDYHTGSFVPMVWGYVYDNIVKPKYFAANAEEKKEGEEEKKEDSAFNGFIRT